MRTIKFPCRGLNYTFCLLSIAVSILLITTVSRFNIPKASSVTVNKLKHYNSKRSMLVSKGKGYPPVLAYWICGTKGEGKKMMRLLKAIYHPRNHYLLQLDDASSDSERLDLAQMVQSLNVFEAFGNVDVIGKSYAINRMGSSGLSAVLHAAALLLKLNADWDWFITLTASDYPLMTQDDLLHAFTFLPEDLNFIHFTNKTIRKEQTDLNQIVVDPSLYYETSTDLFFAVESRDPPDAFNISGGSPWMIFTRAFMDYCVSGWDNLPRKLLMFFTNMVYPVESYFHTLLCNSIDFQNTSIDNFLMFSLWDIDPSESQFLDLSHYDSLLESGAAFARPFAENDLILEKVDDMILNMCSNGLVFGQWCSKPATNRNNHTMDSSSSSKDDDDDDQELLLSFANIDSVKPGLYGIKLRTLLSDVVKRREYSTNQCKKTLNPSEIKVN
ncbi:beta-glucuronosyltransferase GlcAT14C-like [Prosopis cineraria]|uniref:beta-glucuronosyltransferase GlcAT14C-like n=1 Tax=Prosopis cineraria TaxID=364024 RepID=UPI0024101E46|nr:beta-glucuronosyltransferase GlcAT14C-like [Prosopis cineraria]